MANMIVNTLNLEAGDVIKMQADTANEITGVVSYALIDRVTRRMDKVLLKIDCTYNSSLRNTRTNKSI